MIISFAVAKKKLLQLCISTDWAAQRTIFLKLLTITHLVLSALPIDDFVIIGHSMGGLVALLFVER